MTLNKSIFRKCLYWSSIDIEGKPMTVSRSILLASALITLLLAYPTFADEESGQITSEQILAHPGPLNWTTMTIPPASFVTAYT